MTLTRNGTRVPAAARRRCRAPTNAKVGADLSEDTMKHLNQFHFGVQVLVLWSLLFTLQVSGMAQVAGGTIQGTISDPSGALIKGAGQGQGRFHRSCSYDPHNSCGLLFNPELASRQVSSIRDRNRVCTGRSLQRDCGSWRAAIHQSGAPTSWHIADSAGCRDKYKH